MAFWRINLSNLRRDHAVRGPECIEPPNALSATECFVLNLVQIELDSVCVCTQGSLLDTHNCAMILCVCRLVGALAAQLRQDVIGSTSSLHLHTPLSSCSRLLTAPHHPPLILLLAPHRSITPPTPPRPLLAALAVSLPVVYACAARVPHMRVLQVCLWLQQEHQQASTDGFTFAYFLAYCENVASPACVHHCCTGLHAPLPPCLMLAIVLPLAACTGADCCVYWC